MKTVLIIDDDPHMRDSLRTALRLRRFEVLEADAGPVGLQLAGTRHPDLVLCDLYLGTANGFDILAELRRNEATASIPFILITASADPGVMRRCMDLGADDFLRKPFTQEELACAVDGRLTRHAIARKRAEETQRRLLALMEATSDLILILDPQNLTVTYLNQAASRVTGIRLEDRRVSVDDIYFPESVAEIRSIGLPAASGDGRWCGEARLKDAQGGCRQVRQQILAHKGANGLVEFLSIVAHDVTEQKQNAEALAYERYLFQTLMASSPDAIYFKDTQSRFTRVNQAVARRFGLVDPAQAVGKTDFDFFAVEHAQAAYQDEQRIILNGESIISQEERETWPDRPDTWVSTTKLPLRDPHGRIVGTFGLSRDITARKQAIQELAEMHHRNELILNSVEEGILQMDLDGRHTFANQAAIRMLGWTPEELTGSGGHPRCHPTRPNGGPYPCGECLICATLHDGQVRHVTGEVFWRRDKTSFPVEYTVTPIREGERRIGVAVTFRDVSERIRSEAERQRMEVQLRHAQKMESIGRLAAGIAHEINTPTQYIGDNARFLQDAFSDLGRLLAQYDRLLQAVRHRQVSPQLVDEVEEAVRRGDLGYLTTEIPKAIKQSLEGVERVANIVRAMKEFSHPGSEEKTPTDLNRAIESTLTVSRHEWKYVANLVTQFDPTLPPVPCLPGEFNQVILNLVVNAAHAIADAVREGGPGKGTITVSTRRTEGWAEVRVRDTGTGIPKPVQPRIFEPFFTTKGVGKGTGQGLAIAHSVVVDKHGGTIEFETEMGKGTTFLVRLPLQGSAPGAVRASEGSASLRIGERAATLGPPEESR